MTRTPITFDDVVDALLLEEAEPNHAVLLRWSERYPEHRADLADFFAIWAVQCELPQTIEVDKARLANLAVSHALNLLHRRQEEAQTRAPIERNPPRLSAMIQAAGISEEVFAERTGLDETLIIKLDRRRISGRFPSLLFERMANVLATTATWARQIVHGPPILAPGVRHKAQQKPQAVTEDFVAAVRASSLSEEAQQAWIDAVGEEEMKAR
jgi:hypothetical protein